METIKEKEPLSYKEKTVSTILIFVQLAIIIFIIQSIFLTPNIGGLGFFVLIPFLIILVIFEIWGFVRGLIFLKEKKFHLICDNSSCKGAKMVTKEGDELGIEPTFWAKNAIAHKAD